VNLNPLSWLRGPANDSHQIIEPASGAKQAAEPVQKNSGGVPAPFNRVLDSEAQIDKHPVPMPMQQSVWVMRAIKNISDPICAVPLQFLTGPKANRVPFANPDLEAFWEQPGVNLDYEQFIDASVGWIKLKGEAFWLLDDTWLKRSGKKSRLIMAKPENMREIVEDGELIGWVWQSPSSQIHNLIPEQVIQIKTWNPYNQWRGLAEYLAAKIATESDVLQGKQVANLARNNGDQGAYVIAKGNMPTDDQQRQIASQLRMKRQSALKGDLRPIFLAGDITVQSPEIQSPDADFVAVRLENRHEIAIAFGVPPSMFDVIASYSVGSASDRYRLIEDTCIPTARKLTGYMERVSKLFLGLDRNFPLQAKFDFDQHSVMQTVRRERFDSAIKLFGTGMPMDVASQVLGLNLPKYLGSDKGYIPFNLTPVENPLDPTTSPDFSETQPKPVASPEEDEEDDQVAQLSRIFQQRAATKGEDARVREWKKHMAHRQGSIKNYRTKFNKALMFARGQVLAKLASHHDATGKAIEQKAGAASIFMFDLHGFTAEFVSSMNSAARSAYDQAGQQVYDELGKDDPWVSPPAKVKAFLAVRENKLKDVPQEIFDTIKAQLTEGVDKGESIKDLSARVRSTFNEIGNGRGKTIAMTETAAAYGTARQESMTSAGVQYKEWLTSGNANVRPAHADAQGQVRQIDDPFDVDDEELDYPGDPEGSPENVINCHCVSIPIASDDEKALRCVREKRKTI
jgi:SPP1 gp7 family putative phage head morphogenesis protein